ncbi:hypothetical protein CA2015_4781 [Cyclobacterium amurskyense]|uniref:Cytochrome c domain-containing protein n=1 Tax=Cyclobacterium amurskyense TaxID=320787 RepID=A0A0H4PM42_9BACT|nr:hypothetical protein CA2015_4781 [Cyclobacterium amurskyense]|tara:strand:+ start:5529 stop:8336 length:2808 start_codon:yes stop_codon:yes gene_type:complete
MVDNKKALIYILSCTFILGLLWWIVRVIPLENKHKFLPELVLGERVDFNNDIRPIINNKCIACHGGVKRSGGFSLLFEEEALEANESGKRAIVPGNVNKSELIQRITHNNPEYRMPLESTPLSEEEIDLFSRWINQGAQWDDHWAYKAPEKPAVPEIDSKWISNDIDRFVQEKLVEKQLSPNPTSDKQSLLRRLSFDITGLPPTITEMQQFVNDNSDSAYEKVVDSLLASPAYGERWAAMWMDLARYADSKGYEADRIREIWKYRDWLVNAFNENLPYDQFVITQLAGDLKPSPSDQDFIATAFHRNTMNNDEGGTDNEEFRVAAVLDRVNTTWTVLQGTTMECVQCHSHPYDPIRHEDYFRSLAFFNQTADADVPSEAPVLLTYIEEEDQKNLELIKNWANEHGSQNRNGDYYERLLRLGVPKLYAHYFYQMDKGLPIQGTATFKVDQEVYSFTKELPFEGEDRLAFKARTNGSEGKILFYLDSINGEKIGEWKVKARFKKEYDEEEKKEKTYYLNEVISLPIKAVNGVHDLYMVWEGEEGVEQTSTFEWLMLHHTLPGVGNEKYPEVEKAMYALFNSENEKEATPVMVDLPENYHRESRVFEKGSWMVPGEEVEVGVPAIWNPFDEYEGNRMGLAKWLFDKENPLTARVMVNRIWEQFFGRGIVSSLEDFGSQGFAPTHPELLDWLAIKFRDDFDWDIKKLIKEIVMSGTYRQSSHFTEESREKDPLNEWLARGPRIRLNAEQVRDQSLAISGLLSGKMFGKSVMPEQPDGIWQVVYNGTKWETSKGSEKYRRALYTFWRRTSPYPSIISFDAPSREFCLPKRIATNTPLQALVTLNDPVYLDAAIALGRRVLLSSHTDESERLSLMYSLAMVRGISEEKLEALQSIYQQTTTYFENSPEEICKLTGEEDKALAVYTVMANVVMNLDEFLMKS